MQGTNCNEEGGRSACYVNPDLSYGLEGERKRKGIAGFDI